jgi:hypothetical protein
MFTVHRSVHDRLVCLLAVALICANAQAAAGQAPTQGAPAPPSVQTEGNKSAISFYGFTRLDGVLDDSRMNASQLPLFVRPEPEGAEDRSSFTMHPRLTRLGFNYRAPSTATGPVITGRIEIDFHNAGSQSRAIPRYRHVFLQMAWGAHAILAGQTSDIISPLFPAVNADTLMWNAGNLGDRRAQFRYSYEPTRGLSLRAGIGLTGAIDNADVDANGVPDGEASTLPNFQGRVGYNSPKVLAGIWGHYSQVQTDTAYGGKREFDGHSIGGDIDVRFTRLVGLRGEVWMGSNLGDVRGGVGQTFNTATGNEIDSRGGWLELGLKRGRYAFSVGSTLDDPDDDQVPVNGFTRNGSWYVTNSFRVAPPVTAGVDYTYWTTEYRGASDGTDNRVNLYVMFTF